MTTKNFELKKFIAYKPRNSKTNEMHVHFVIESELGSHRLNEVVRAYSDGSVHIDRNSMQTLNLESAERKFLELSDNGKLFTLDNLADKLVSELELIGLAV